MRSQSHDTKARLFPVLAAAITLAVAGTTHAQCSTAAAEQKFGVSTSGPAGPPILQTRKFFGGPILPKLGSSSWIELWYPSRSGPGHQFLLLLSTKRANLPFLGGKLYVDPNSIVAQLPGKLSPPFGQEFWTLRIRIPNDTSLCGKIGVFQAGILDSQAKGGLVLTNRLEWKVGK